MRVAWKLREKKKRTSGRRAGRRTERIRATDEGRSKNGPENEIADRRRKDASVKKKKGMRDLKGGEEDRGREKKQMREQREKKRKNAEGKEFLEKAGIKKGRTRERERGRHNTASNPVASLTNARLLISH